MCCTLGMLFRSSEGWAVLKRKCALEAVQSPLRRLPSTPSKDIDHNVVCG